MWDDLKDRLVLRSQSVSNSPEVIRRLGVIAMNTPVEVFYSQYKFPVLAYHFDITSHQYNFFFTRCTQFQPMSR